MNIAAVVVVGGTGLDPLVPVGGVPLFVRAIEALDRTDEFTRVHVLLDASIDAIRAQAVAAACAGVGGLVAVSPHLSQRRTEAESNGSDTLSIRRIALDPAHPVDAVVVHDAARGLAPPSLVRAVVDGLRAGHDVVVPVLPLTDTVKVVDANGFVRATPDRAGLRVVQTPQGFRSAVLEQWPGASGGGAVLGMAPALAESGVAVRMVPGDPLAFAVHTPGDLRLAEELWGEDG